MTSPDAATTDEAVWDEEVDFVVVGSGGGGMVAAITAAEAGAAVVVLEKQDLIGGSTCMSGGIAWIPDNPIMRQQSVDDSLEDALAHFDAVVGDIGPASSIERREAFLTTGGEMVGALQRRGVELVHCPGYSDYYSDATGGHDIGRGIEPTPYNGRALGPWLERLQPGLAQSVGLVVMTNESRDLGHYNRSLRSFLISARVVIRTVFARVRRQTLLTNGASLIAQLLRVAIDDDVAVWTGAPLTGLIVENERVVGVETVRDGSPVRVRARHGVLLSAGGFAHNAEMRAAHGGNQPNEAKWSIANPGDTGEAMGMAMALGAKTDLMDEAWWLPSPRTGRFGQSTLDQARQRPRTIYVDAAGERFVNESNSYMEVGKAMYERDKTSRAVPCWLVFDDRYRKRYAHLKSSPGRFPKKLLESGRLKKAPTLAELAEMCEIDVDGLAATVAYFNEHAANGEDPLFGRGESAYNRALGDPNRRVHPCVEPIDEGPFYACQVLPGDIGTCGGLLTDQHARVLGSDDRPIEGLYAAGNITATVMGRHYLGPGASIANTMVFGYIAAQHAAAGITFPSPLPA
ncbi:MAG: FAD-dependent oxidoreductase [Acidimicrobiales bacterium]|nr:FAD-dependent oxidoreductase [Acidimicrobiales bacterium]